MSQLEKEVLADPSFQAFMAKAYAKKEGYAIRRNPFNGKKEMAIAGSRSMTDHAKNAFEFWGQHLAHRPMDRLVYKAVRNRYRNPAIKKFTKAVIENDVDIVYGHSRGGAILADMKIPRDIRKVGLDAAMIIADNKKMRNYRQSFYHGGPTAVFDLGIGATGRDNIGYTTRKRFHKVWK